MFRVFIYDKSLERLHINYLSKDTTFLLLQSQPKLLYHFLNYLFPNEKKHTNVLNNLT